VSEITTDKEKITTAKDHDGQAEIATARDHDGQADGQDDDSQARTTTARQGQRAAR